jgi:hypothetical protein
LVLMVFTDRPVNAGDELSVHTKFCTPSLPNEVRSAALQQGSFSGLAGQEHVKFF